MNASDAQYGPETTGQRISDLKTTSIDIANQLANTGFDAWILAVIGAMLMGVGLVLLALQRNSRP